MGGARDQKVLQVDAADLDFVVVQARALGVQATRLPSRGVEPVSTVAVVVVGATVAVAALLRALDERRGGQVIDLRPGARREIYRDRELMYGSLVVWTGDGKVIARIKQPDDLLGQALEVLSALRGNGAPALESRTVAARIADALGDGAVVEVEAAAGPPDEPPG